VSAPKDADAAFRTAADKTKQINDWQSKVDEALREITEGLSKFELPPLERERIAAERYRKLIPQLRAPGQWLLDNKKSFDAAFASLLKAIEDSLPALKAAGDRCRQTALEEKDPAIREQYEVMASEAGRLIQSYTAHLAALKHKQGVIDQQVVFVQKSVVLLDRIEIFLGCYPPTTNAMVDVYLQQLSDYLARYQQAMQVLRNIRDIARPVSFMDLQEGDSVVSVSALAFPNGFSLPVGTEFRFVGVADDGWIDCTYEYEGETRTTSIRSEYLMPVAANEPRGSKKGGAS
jgi:hypothetical protein